MRRIVVGNKEILSAVALLMVLVSIFFYKVVFFGQILLPADNLLVEYPWKAYFPDIRQQNPLLSDLILAFYPWKQFVVESFRSGSIPLWNPYSFSGHPLLANAQSTVFSPFNLIFLLFPLSQAFGYCAVLQVFLAGFFTYLFARQIGLTSYGAIVSSVTFAFGGFSIILLTWPELSVGLWLPLMLWLYERHLASGRWAFAIGAGLAFGVQFLSGHPQISIYVGLAFGLYATYRAITRMAETGQLASLIQPLLALLAGMVVGLGVGAIQLLPTLELVKLGLQTQGSENPYLFKMMPGDNLISFFVPNFFGSFTEGTVWGWWATDEQVYVGILAYLLSLLSIFMWRDRYVRFFLGMAGLSIVLASGLFFSSYLYSYAPLLNRTPPDRILFLYAFSAAVLAGVGADVALGKVAATMPRRVLGVILVGAVSAMATTTFFAVTFWPRLSQEGPPVQAYVAKSIVVFLALLATSVGLLSWAIRARSSVPSIWRQGRSMVLWVFGCSFVVVAADLVTGGAATNAPILLANIRQVGIVLRVIAQYLVTSNGIWILALLAGVAGCVLIWVVRFRPSRRTVARVCVLGLIFFDLLAYGGRFNSATGPGQVYPSTPEIDFIRQDQDYFRVLGLGKGSASWTMLPNSTMGYQIYDIRGYDALYPRRYWEYIDLVTNPSFTFFEDQKLLDIVRGASGRSVSTQYDNLIVLDKYDSPLIDLLNVKYVLSPVDIALFREGVFSLERLVSTATIETPINSFNPVGVMTVSIDADNKRAIFEHPPTSIYLPVSIPENAELRFAVGLDPRTWSADKGDGVEFEIAVEDEQTREVVYSRYIDPKSNPGDRKWHEATVDLSEFVGRKLRLVLTTRPGPQNDNTFDWAYWGNPVLAVAEATQGRQPKLVLDKAIRVYENPDRLPRAFVVHQARVLKDPEAVLQALTSSAFDPRAEVILEEDAPIVAPQDPFGGHAESTVKIVKYSPNEVLVDVAMGRDGFLVLADSYYPGWRAFVDGTEQKVYQADYILRSVYLPTGNHQVRFVFDPLSFRLGVTVALATLAISLLVLAWDLRRRPWRPEGGIDAHGEGPRLDSVP